MSEEKALMAGKLLLHMADNSINALQQRIKELEASEKCWISNAKALQVGYNELDAKCAKLEGTIDNLQAKIDGLMLEHCPEHMTECQLREWEKAQVVYIPSAPI